MFVPVALAFAWTLFVAIVGRAVQVAQIGEPVALSGRIVAALVREACARLLLRALNPLLGHGPPRVERALTAAESRRLPPVILLGGLTWGPASLMFLRRFLVQRGWGWVISAQRGGPDSTLATEAEALARLVARARRLSGEDKVDLVGFSAGGLVAAWYLRHHEEAAGSIRRLVTVATPWRGTRMAVFGHGAAARQVRYGSHLLDELWPPPVPVVCIYSADDGIIVPATSAVPESAHHSVCIEDAGHVELLLSPRSLRAVQAALEHPLAQSAEAPS